MSHGDVPLIVEKCIAEIEKRGLEEVGIYRVPGAVSAINRLRLSFNSGKIFSLGFYYFSSTEATMHLCLLLSFLFSIDVWQINRFTGCESGQ